MSLEAVHRSGGEAIDYTPGSDVSAGDVVLIGNLVAYAKADIDSGIKGALYVGSVVDLRRGASTAFALGDEVYWDEDGTSESSETGAAVRDAATGDAYAGICIEAAADSTDVLTVRTLLLPAGASTDPDANTTAAG